MFFFNTLITFLKNREYRHLLYTTNVIILIGTLCYHFIEGWSYVDSLYFSVVTLTTIGFGDLHPVTDGGKLFTVAYVILGVVIILQFINTLQNHYKSSRDTYHKK